MCCQRCSHLFSLFGRLESIEFKPNPRLVGMSNIKIKFIILIFLLFASFPSKVFAFNQKDLGKLKSTNICKKCDLSRADLSGANLRHADLSEANLSEANLRGANLNRAELDRADLRHSNMRGTELNGANLRHTNLRGTDLSGASLIEADLTRANLNFGILRGANLSKADLFEANLSNAKFVSFIFCNTKMPDGKENNSGCKNRSQKIDMKISGER